MTITISKLTDKQIPEHWRILILEGDSEIYTDSATTKLSAINRILEFLLEKMEMQRELPETQLDVESFDLDGNPVLLSIPIADANWIDQPPTQSK